MENFVMVSTELYSALFRMLTGNVDTLGASLSLYWPLGMVNFRNFKALGQVCVTGGKYGRTQRKTIS